MNRSDRMVAIVTYLQGRRLVRAEDLAAHFEVSLRTIYRDIAALGEAGVPVSGEAGVGYTLVKGYHLPPVSFTADEAIALFLGAEMLKRFTDASTKEPAASALNKIRSVLPRERQDELDRLARKTLVGGASRLQSSPRALLPIEKCLAEHRVLKMWYKARDRAAAEEREVEPLGLVFGGDLWYLVAWCRLRSALRHFRVDRIENLQVLGKRFVPREEFSLQKHWTEMSASQPVLEVRLRVNPAVLERLCRESGTEVEVLGETEKGLNVRLSTYSLSWLAHWLLSFGGDVIALEPAALRSKVRELVKAVEKNHERFA